MPTEPTASILEALAPLERRIKEAIYLSSTEVGGDIRPDYIMAVCQMVVNEIAEAQEAGDETEKTPEELLAELLEGGQEDPVVGFDVDPGSYEDPAEHEEVYEEDDDEYWEDVPAHGAPSHTCYCSKCGRRD